MTTHKTAVTVDGLRAIRDALDVAIAHQGWSDEREDERVEMTTDLYDHPDFLAFISTIRADPDADLPRLACADWLDEHGDGDRAEYVRTAVWLDRNPVLEKGTFRKLIEFIAGRNLRDSDEYRRVAKERYDKESKQEYLIASNVIRWSLGLPVPCDPKLLLFHDSSGPPRFYPDSKCFSRGFVEYLEIPTAAFFSPGLAYRVCRRNPVRRIKLVDRPAQRIGAGWGHMINDERCTRIPREIWIRLYEMDQEKVAIPIPRVFSTEQKADAAFSDSLLAWALSRAAADYKPPSNLPGAINRFEAALAPIERLL